MAGFLERTGVIRATPGNAAAALARGALVLVFPGGDYDVYRPTRRENVIDFGGRTGYVTTAIRAGVPIVPSVSIGGQENQFYVARGRRLARALRLTGFERRLFRTDILPISVGFPFGYRSTFRFRRRSSLECCRRSTSLRSSGTTPTSARSMSMSGPSCRRAWTNWPHGAASRSSAEHDGRTYCRRSSARAVAITL